MLHCPEHIENLVVNANEYFPGAHDNFHHFFQLKCPCGGDKFSLLEGSNKSLVATCGRCGCEWRIYDLVYYTSASKAKGEEIFNQVLVSNEEACNMFIGYEYGETDDDDEFDRNDITWCDVFIKKGGTLEEIFSDETA